MNYFLPLNCFLPLNYFLKVVAQKIFHQSKYFFTFLYLNVKNGGFFFGNHFTYMFIKLFINLFKYIRQRKMFGK
ncbi:hypothetical protein TRFO_25952 [Tritrichomonas foetus]|uniref:Uncharacterized protein n=1 Tax=Tritrichomonas foetus TaxID=1144522 RepID=A0A1J4K5K1_9EUKA|nr:hypothetical protein TRFO_25952 [Tritrichomonas foetus]|eukprot:OHT06152.1 hypothetical protein TRFO_25952 [Tritrichomonas foetus]